MKNLMEARDSVSGSLAECYVTLTGRRYCLMQLTEFESKWGITLTDYEIAANGIINGGEVRYYNVFTFLFLNAFCYFFY